MQYVYPLAPFEQAFNDYVDTVIPNVNSDLWLCHDYEECKGDWSDCEVIRAMTTVINWKSNVGNSDTTHNFRTKLSVDLKRGDYVKDIATGEVGMIVWFVDKMPDCNKTQVSGCNLRTTIYRPNGVPEVIDPRTGTLVQKASDLVIAEEYPCVYTTLYGRYDYEMRNNTPGIAPDQKIEVKIQFNEATRQIREGDLLDIHGILHRVMFVTMSTVDIDETHGVMVLTCERVAGGS